MLLASDQRSGLGASSPIFSKPKAPVSYEKQSQHQEEIAVRQGQEQDG